jgi:hypothetical protein
MMGGDGEADLLAHLETAIGLEGGREGGREGGKVSQESKDKIGGFTRPSYMART